MISVDDHDEIEKEYQQSRKAMRQICTRMK